MGVYLIRRAVVDDLDFILVELREFSTFFDSKHKLFSDDIEYNKKVLTIFIEKHLFFVAEIDGVKAGFIVGSLHQHVYNPTLMCLTENFWWVKPEFRGSRAGALLFKEFVRFGEECCDWIVMTLESNSPVKPETLTKRGFKHKESAFIKEI